jgi:hypothetical protein
MQTFMEEPISQGEVNRSVRVLKGKPLKYTVYLIMKDGSEYETQCEGKPKLDYSIESRSVQLVSGYDALAICEWSSVAMCRVDENVV